jgi:hypothetical protein
MTKIAMKERIGLTAGSIWDELEKTGELSLTRLTKLVKENPRVVYQGLGWLAREDKIAYREDDGKVFVSLVEGERG